MTRLLFANRRYHAFVLFGLLAILASGVAGCGRTQPTGAAKSVQTEGALFSRAVVGGERLDPAAPEFNTEAYDAVEENSFVEALKQPQSTFSIDVDTASYSNVRRMLSDGQTPPAGAVRIEELVNYFRYDYPQPSGEHPFSVSAELAVCPWNEAHHLLRVGLQGQSLDMSERPACNLVFLLDVSGSMMQANKLPLVKSAMKMLVEQLDERDRIAIAVYAGAAGAVLESTPASEGVKILGALEQLQAGGSTNGGSGINLAYQMAEEGWIAGGVNRVILCTDGDFNVGTTNDSELVKLIQEKAKGDAARPVFLSVMGFGTGNLKDSTMEQLADEGNGNYSYIDGLLEARKVLVEEIGSTLVTIAKDVKIQIDFNPQHVQAYRLIGYENRMLENRDFRDDAKDAGEIGAGHSVTAFYEIVPASADSKLEASRDSEFVQSSLAENADTATQLTINLRYKQPEAETSQEFQVRLPAGDVSSEPSADFQFASSVVAYGMLLRDSQFAGTANWQWVVDTASQNIGNDQRGLRGEFVQLAKTARRIAQ